MDICTYVNALIVGVYSYIYIYKRWPKITWQNTSPTVQVSVYLYTCGYVYRYNCIDYWYVFIYITQMAKDYLTKDGADPKDFKIQFAAGFVSGVSHVVASNPMEVRAMTDSCVCNDWFICVPWLIHMCAMSHSYVYNDSFMCVPWLKSCVRHDSFTHVPWLSHMCTMTYLYVCHDSFIRVPWFIHTCAMTHWYMCHDSFICVPWPKFALGVTSGVSHVTPSNPMKGCDMTHSYGRHDSIICAPWLNYMCVAASYPMGDVWHGSFMRGGLTRLVHMGDVWHDWFVWCEYDVTHPYESWHIRMSHGTHMNDSWHTYEWVMAHSWMSNGTLMSPDSFVWVVTYQRESRPIKWCTAHSFTFSLIRVGVLWHDSSMWWASHKTRSHESWRICMSHDVSTRVTSHSHESRHTYTSHDSFV